MVGTDTKQPERGIVESRTVDGRWPVVVPIVTDKQVRGRLMTRVT